MISAIVCLARIGAIPFQSFLRIAIPIMAVEMVLECGLINWIAGLFDNKKTEVEE